MSSPPLVLVVAGCRSRPAPPPRPSLAETQADEAGRLARMLPPFTTRQSTIDIDAKSLPRDLVEQLRALGYVR